MGAAVVATDAAGNGLAYSLAGPNATDFAIGASTGQLTTAAVLDHEAGASRSVTVSAADANGGATSIPVTVLVTNVAEPPDAPSAPTVAGASSTSLSVTWSAPANTGRPALTDYDVQYRAGTDDFADWAHAGTATTATITGLEADTAYQVQVLARNADGASAWSASGEGRTETADEGLTARFENVPDSHDGASVFTLELAFSEPVFEGSESFDKNRAIRNALEVTGGAVRGGRRADRDVYDRWILRIGPAGEGDVTVRLPATTGSCDAAGAICTPDGRPLSMPASVTIPGPSSSADASDSPVEGDVRLVGGATPLEGRVEIHHDGAWGTVCDDGFSPEDAAVVCRQLGYAGGAAHRRAAFGEGTGAIRMDDVRCAGSESRLADCPFAGWGLHNCRHAEDAGVSCGAAAGNPLANAAVSGALVTLRFARPLDSGSVPSPDDFVVAAGTAQAPIPVESVAVASGEALLTLSRAGDASELVTVSYLPGAMHPLQDASYNPVPALTGRPVRHTPRADRQTVPAAPPETASWAAAKVEVLDLSASGLSDLSSLTGLADVEVLHLGGNRVDDLWPLTGMPDLEVLDLGGNAVDDLSALASLPHLRVLDLSGNAVSDISPLAGLTALRRLDLSDNRVADLRPLSERRGLEVLLLDGNQVADLVPLWGLRELAHLGLGDNRVADAAVLRELRSLERLDLAANGLRDVSVLGDLPNLVWLRVSGNPIVDVSPLGRLTSVRWLMLDVASRDGERP